MSRLRPSTADLKSGRRSSFRRAADVPRKSVEFVADAPASKASRMTAATDRFYLFDDADGRSPLQAFKDADFKDPKVERVARWKRALGKKPTSRVLSEAAEGCARQFKVENARMDKLVHRAENARSQAERNQVDDETYQAYMQSAAKRQSFEFTPVNPNPTGKGVYLSYVLQKTLGTGATGRVYLGEHLPRAASKDLFLFGQLDDNLVKNCGGVTEYDIPAHIGQKLLKKHYLSDKCSKIGTAQEKETCKKIKKKIKEHEQVALKFIKSTPTPNPGKNLQKADAIVQALRNLNTVTCYQHEIKTLTSVGRREKGDTSRVGADSIVYMLFMYPEKPVLAHANYCVAFEFMPRGSLSGILHGELDGFDNHTSAAGVSYQISDSWSKHWFLQLLSAVYFLHKREIAHLDIKSENILLSATYDAKLHDFGIAEAYTDSAIYTNGIKHYGTPYWRQIEACANDDEARTCFARRDIYGLGALLARMVSGSDPWQGGKLSPSMGTRCSWNDEISAGFGLGLFTANHVNHFQDRTVTLLPHTVHSTNPRPLHLALRMMSTMHNRHETVAEVLDDVWLNPSVSPKLGVPLRELEDPDLNPNTQEPLYHAILDEVPGERGLFTDRSFGIYTDNQMVHTPSSSRFFSCYRCKSGGRRLQGDSAVEQMFAGEDELKQNILSCYEQVVGRNGYFLGFVKELYKLIISEGTAVQDAKQNFDDAFESALASSNNPNDNREVDEIFNEKFDDCFNQYLTSHPTYTHDKDYYRSSATCQCFQNRVDLHPDQFPYVSEKRREMGGVEAGHLAILGKDTRLPQLEANQPQDDNMTFYITCNLFES